MLNHTESRQVPIFSYHLREGKLTQKSFWFVKSRVNFSELFLPSGQKVDSSIISSANLKDLKDLI